MNEKLLCDSHHFTSDELRFYIQTASHYLDLTDEQVENERGNRTRTRNRQNPRLLRRVSGEGN